MATTATLYHPKNESLAEKVQGYRVSLDAMQKIEASKALSNNREWAQSLGDENELEDAYNLCRFSLDMAMESINPMEIQQALLEGLIDSNEAKTYEIAQRKSQIDKSRDHPEKTKGADFEPE